jgi:hypothetical protein
VRGFLLFLVVIFAAIAALPYFVLPSVLENLVAREVQDRLSLPREPGVRLDSDPQWEMLLGEFSQGRVSVGGTDLGGVRAENVAVDLDPFSVDVGRSVQGQTVVVNEPVSGQVRVKISEDEISRLAQTSAQVPVNDVNLARSGATIESEASLLGTTFPVTVSGNVGVEGNALVFEPQNIRAAGVAVPQNLADSFLAETTFRYPVQGLPYGATLTGARTVDGAVVLTGDVNGVELGQGG